MHDSPSPQDIAQARSSAGLTQDSAAALIGAARRSWQDWERGVTPMPVGMYRLFRHLAGLERIPFRARSA